jgi:hypothetical protein
MSIRNLFKNYMSDESSDDDDEPEPVDEQLTSIRSPVIAEIIQIDDEIFILVYRGEYL